VLFVGAGEMIELCATHFAARNPKAIAIANRTLERGEKLATRFGGEVMRLADLPERLHEFDAVISCTASSLPIIGLGAVERALKKRRHRPIFMVDLAVPRDIEPEVKAAGGRVPVHRGRPGQRGADRPGQPPGRRGAGRGHHRRRRAELHALDGAAQPRHRGGVVPLIQQLNAQADEWRALESPARQALLAKGEDVDAVLEALSRGLTQKMLHGTMAELRAGDAEARAAGQRTAVSAPVPAQKNVSCGACPHGLPCPCRSQIGLPQIPAQTANSYQIRGHHLLFRSHETLSPQPAGALCTAPGRAGLPALPRRHHGRHGAVPLRCRASTPRSPPWPAAMPATSSASRPGRRARAAGPTPTWPRWRRKKSPPAEAELAATGSELQRLLLPKDPTTHATPSWKSARAPAATSRPCSRATWRACTRATRQRRAGRSRS
jgi:hypothetical protein